MFKSHNFTDIDCHYNFILLCDSEKSESLWKSILFSDNLFYLYRPHYSSSVKVKKKNLNIYFYCYINSTITGKVIQLYTLRKTLKTFPLLCFFMKNVLYLVSKMLGWEQASFLCTEIFIYSFSDLDTYTHSPSFT